MIANVLNSSLNFKGAYPTVREAYDNKTRELNEIAKKQNELALSFMNGTDQTNAVNKTQAQISMQGINSQSAGQKLDVIA